MRKCDVLFGDKMYGGRIWFRPEITGLVIKNGFC